MNLTPQDAARPAPAPGAWTHLEHVRDSACAHRRRLEEILGQMAREGLLVAFSGGVDSTLLLHEARRVLGDRCVAAISVSESLARSELERARQIAASLGAGLVEVRSHEMENPDYLKNGPDRCYFCKKELFEELAPVARELGLGFIAHGAMADDLGDYRPGGQAAREAGARAPLQEAGLTKDEIRWLSREAGLPTWDQPAQPCLSSRFAYGQAIEPSTLHVIEEAESFLRSLGVRQVRLRHHGRIARIEVDPEHIARLATPEVRQQVVDFLAARGYLYVTLDLAGFRSGSLNRVLPEAARQASSSQPGAGGNGET